MTKSRRPLPQRSLDQLIGNDRTPETQQPPVPSRPWRGNQPPGLLEALRRLTKKEKQLVVLTAEVLWGSYPHQQTALRTFLLNLKAQVDARFSAPTSPDGSIRKPSPAQQKAIDSFNKIQGGA